MPGGVGGVASRDVPLSRSLGTFQTRLAIRLESVMRCKADIGEMNIAACLSRLR